MTNAARNERAAKIGLIGVGILIALGAVTLVGLVVADSQWDPLDAYPIQPAHVVDYPSPPDAGSGDAVIPTIWWDQQIGAEAVKCVDDSEGVIQVRGELSWVSSIPPGHIIAAGVGAADRGPGCVSYEFTNRIPAEVLDEMAKMKLQGRDYSEWHLTGTETPIREDGSEGRSRTWTTTTFRVLHEDSPQ